MRIPQFRLRTLMIGIVILAPLIVVWSWLLEINSSLNDFYGPMGSLRLGSRVSTELSAGADHLQHARYVEAENSYRSALWLNELLEKISARHGWLNYHSSADIMIGLADSLAGQNRSDEAEAVYREIQRRIGPDEAALADISEQNADLARRMGDSETACRRLVRAKAIRDKPARHDH